MLDTARARPTAGPPPGGAPSPTLQGALGAVSWFARKAPRSPASIAAFHLPAEVRTAWLVGVRGALNEVPVLAVAVTAGGLSAATGLELGADSPIPGRLVDVGVSRITIWRGATDRELGALAAMLCTRWAPGDERSFDTEVWAAGFENVVFERSRAREQRAYTPPARLSFVQEDAHLSEEAVRVLHELRETAAPAPGALIEVHATTRALPAELAADVATVVDGMDLPPAALGAALLALGVPVSLVVAASCELFAAGREVGALFHAYVDDGVTFEGLEEAGFAQRLADVLPAEETQTARAGLFSLLHLLNPAVSCAALADTLPRWGLIVLADVLLAREIQVGATRSVGERLRATTIGELRIGLAMASRLDDPRTTERVLALVDHGSPAIREAALLSLRQQTNPRVHQRVIKALDDASPAVRVEALRYAVAHRLGTAVPWLEHAVAEGLTGKEESEIRAMCVALGKLGRERAEPTLLGLVRRRSPASRFALHGLRAAGGMNMRASLELAAAEDPSLRAEVDALLAEVA
jgi:hypothetical protein